MTQGLRKAALDHIASYCWCKGNPIPDYPALVRSKLLWLGTPPQLTGFELWGTPDTTWPGEAAATIFLPWGCMKPLRLGDCSCHYLPAPGVCETSEARRLQLLRSPSLGGFIHSWGWEIAEAASPSPGDSTHFQG